MEDGKAPGAAGTPPTEGGAIGIMFERLNRAVEESAVSAARARMARETVIRLRAPGPCSLFVLGSIRLRREPRRLRLVHRSRCEVALTALLTNSP